MLGSAGKTQKSGTRCVVGGRKHAQIEPARRSSGRLGALRCAHRLTVYPSLPHPFCLSPNVVRHRAPRSANPAAAGACPAVGRRYLHPRWHRQGKSRRRPSVLRICWFFLPLLSWTTLNNILASRAYVVNLPLCQTLDIKRTRPHPPAPNSVVLGSVTRLSPQQAVLSISVVDGVPLPAGEEFTGVIRVQDVRATEKDKVKIADCFRGGDVIRGLVVCSFHHVAALAFLTPLPAFSGRCSQLLCHDCSE